VGELLLLRAWFITRISVIEVASLQPINGSVKERSSSRHPDAGDPVVG
jgi:hypothetical protein